MFADSSKLHVISWNACGVTSYGKQASLKSYVRTRHPDVIFVQDAFIGLALPGQEAPELSGYVSYVLRVRHGLIT